MTNLAVIKEYSLLLLLLLFSVLTPDLLRAELPPSISDWAVAQRNAQYQGTKVYVLADPESWMEPADYFVLPGFNAADLAVLVPVVEDFDNEPLNATTFSESGLSFSATGGLRVSTFPGFSQYMDRAATGSGLVGSFNVTTANASFAVERVTIYPSDDGGTSYTAVGVTFTGTPSAGGGAISETISPVGGNSGTFGEVSFAATAFDGVPLSSLSFTLPTGFDYLAIDDFEFDATTTGAPIVSVLDTDVQEGDNGVATLTFTVARTNDASNFSVDFATADGTATDGTDYVGQSTTLNFTAGGSLTQTVTIQVAGDEIFEGNETLTATLSNPTGGAILGQASSTGTILDDEVLCEDYETDGPVGETEFTGPEGETFSVSGVLEIGSFPSGGSGNSDFYLETEITNVPYAGNVGTITLTSGGTAFVVDQLDMWISDDAAPDDQDMGTARFIGTLAGGGTAQADLTTSASGGTFTQNLSFIGTPLENQELTSLSVELIAPANYVAIDNLKYAMVRPPTCDLTAAATVGCDDNGSAGNTADDFVTFTLDFAGSVDNSALFTIDAGAGNTVTTTTGQTSPFLYADAGSTTFRL
ncbi:MAG: Calx-beta domain-containing protein, partial [Bacteroidota bacterium]